MVGEDEGEAVVVVADVGEGSKWAIWLCRFDAEAHGTQNEEQIWRYIHAIAVLGH